MSAETKAWASAAAWALLALILAIRLNQPASAILATVGLGTQLALFGDSWAGDRRSPGRHRSTRTQEEQAA